MWRLVVRSADVQSVVLGVVELELFGTSTHASGFSVPRIAFAAKTRQGIVTSG